MARILQSTVATRPSDYSYPADCDVEVLKNESGEIHRIVYNGAPGALFNNAPNGSTLLRITAGTGYFYAKTGTRGLTDGTWVGVALA